MVVPVGCKFLPSDEQLLGFFLKDKIINGASTNHPMIYECDLYGKEEPWQVWGKYRPRYEGLFEGGAVDAHSDLYFFTKLKKKDPTHKKIMRRVGPSGGTWHGYSAGKEIRAQGAGVVIGILKMFIYKNPRSEQSGKWIMHEYILCDGDFDGVVLCRLRRKHEAPVMTTDAISFGPDHLIQAGVEQDLVELNNQVTYDHEILCSLSDFLELEPLETAAPCVVHGGEIDGAAVAPPYEDGSGLAWVDDCTWADIYRISSAKLRGDV